jgi:hypothetical protein
LQCSSSVYNYSPYCKDGAQPRASSRISENAGFNPDHVRQHGHLHQFLLLREGISEAIWNKKNFKRYRFKEGEERLYPADKGTSTNNEIIHVTFNRNHFIYLPVVYNSKTSIKKPEFDERLGVNQKTANFQ